MYLVASLAGLLVTGPNEMHARERAFVCLIFCLTWVLCKSQMSW